jgi:dolichol-phosphate mannosyltransferase
MTLKSVEGNLDLKSEVGILLPTYCEAANIGKLIHDIEHLGLNASVLVIDDSSPDGTAELVRTLQDEYRNVLVSVRPRKSGLGTAITDGFKIFLSLKNPPEYVVTMDADYSHSPRDLPRIVSAAREANGLAIGSRYCLGGGTVNWGVSRWAISRVANMLSAFLIGAKIHDYTSGLRCYSMNLIRNIVSELHSETYEIQIETIRQARKKGFAIREVPMVFVNRKKGKSKLTKNEIREFLSYTVRIGLEQK